MPRTEIKYDDYKVKAFLDTNIILECRPLDELPWHEIDADGPIIVLLTPTAIKEVDSKKQDGQWPYAKYKRRSQFKIKDISSLYQKFEFTDIMAL